MGLIGQLILQKRLDSHLSREAVQRILSLGGYDISLYKIKRIENSASSFLNLRDIMALAEVLDISLEEIKQCDELQVVSKPNPLFQKEGV